MRRLLLVPLLAMVLSGCATDPVTQIRDDVEAVIVAANGSDAAGVRRAVDDLLRTVSEQRSSRELTAEKADELTRLAQAVSQQAGALDPAAPSPSPSASPPPSPSPEPPPSPSPPPPPSPSPSPSPEPEPEEPPVEEPPPSPSPSPVVTPVEPSPAAAAQPSPPASPAA